MFPMIYPITTLLLAKEEDKKKPLFAATHVEACVF